MRNCGCEELIQLIFNLGLLIIYQFSDILDYNQITLSVLNLNRDLLQMDYIFQGTLLVINGLSLIEGLLNVYEIHLRPDGGRLESDLKNLVLRILLRDIKYRRWSSTLLIGIDIITILVVWLVRLEL